MKLGGYQGDFFKKPELGRLSFQHPLRSSDYLVLRYGLPLIKWTGGAQRVDDQFREVKWSRKSGQGDLVYCGGFGEE
jgi:hypothetical protein